MQFSDGDGKPTDSFGEQTAARFPEVRSLAVLPRPGAPKAQIVTPVTGYVKPSSLSIVEGFISQRPQTGDLPL